MHLVLVDGSGFIFRAFHALPPMTRADGTHVNAVFGFGNMLARFLQTHTGTHLAVVFDAGRTTFRNRMYADYKAHRPEPPPELVPQFALVRQATEAFNVPSIELEDWEADDLIASPTRPLRWPPAGGLRSCRPTRTSCSSSGPGIEMQDPIKQKPIGPDEVFEKFGVTPDRVVQIMALTGDSVDNVPGRARHRPQERAPAHHRVRRHRGRARGRPGDEAVETPGHADRACRARAHQPRSW